MMDSWPVVTTVALVAVSNRRKVNTTVNGRRITMTGNEAIMDNLIDKPIEETEAKAL